MGQVTLPLYFGLMNEVIKSIIQEAMFDDNILAETITYNGVAVPAIVEVGATDKIYSPAIYHSRNAVSVYSDGFFTVKTDNVPAPKHGDKIVYQGKNYYVNNIALVDSAGGNVTVEVRADEKVYRNT